MSSLSPGSAKVESQECSRCASFALVSFLADFLHVDRTVERFQLFSQVSWINPKALLDRHFALLVGHHVHDSLVVRSSMDPFLCWNLAVEAFHRSSETCLVRPHEAIHFGNPVLVIARAVGEVDSYGSHRANSLFVDERLVVVHSQSHHAHCFDAFRQSLDDRSQVIPDHCHGIALASDSYWRHAESGLGFHQVD